MKPDVLAWALLFVVAVGVAYRFTAWAMGPRESASGAVPLPHPKPGVVASEQNIEPVASEAITPSVLPPPNILTPMPPSVPETVSRAPSSPIAPDVRATLAPVAIATAIELPTDSKLPPSALTAINDDCLAMGEQRATIRWRGTRLRARKIGQETASLGERIKKTLTRRPRSAAKPVRKLSTLREQSDPAVAYAVLRRASSRRIGRKPDDGNPLASTKAVTKIVGVAPRSPRVRMVPAHVW